MESMKRRPNRTFLTTVCAAAWGWLEPWIEKWTLISTHVHPPQTISQLCCPILHLSRPSQISLHKNCMTSWHLNKSPTEFLQFMKRCTCAFPFVLQSWTCWSKRNLISRMDNRWAQSRKQSSCLKCSAVLPASIMHIHVSHSLATPGAAVNLPILSPSPSEGPWGT